MNKKILEKFRRTIKHYELLKPGDKVLVAYSGGADSTALLELLLGIRDEMSLELYLAHFNHQLRINADEDEKFVRRVAHKLGLPLFVKKENVKSYARKFRLNLEEAGRNLRYEFLKKTASTIGATKIATGHTMTDQAETFFMRLLRGSGMRGLSGIYPVAEEKIIRPLIEVEREELESFLKNRGLGFRTDESNFDRRFLRNRIRLDLIPFLKKNYDPQIVSRLAKLTSIIQEEESFLEKLAEAKSQHLILRKNNQIFLKTEPLSALPRALARRCVRNFISELRGNLRGITFQDIESILNLGQGKEIYLKRNLCLRRERGLIFLKGKTPPKLKYEYSWDGKSPLFIKEIGWRFSGKKLEKKKGPPFSFDDQNRCYCDWQKLKFPLVVRSRKEGDRYQPLGSPGRKKLKEIMRAKGIPVSEREKHPVFLSGDRIVWIPGLPVSEEFKVKPKTRIVFQIKKL